MCLFNQLSACRQMFAYCCMFYVRCKRARTCPHAWMLSLMWQVSNMLKAVITSIFRGHWRIHQGFIHFCLSEWSKWAGRTCHHSSWEVVLFFLISAVTFSVLRWQEMQFINCGWHRRRWYMQDCTSPDNSNSVKPCSCSVPRFSTNREIPEVGEVDQMKWYFEVCVWVPRCLRQVLKWHFRIK